jgi:MYXO-CTERM domain-containing protein
MTAMRRSAALAALLLAIFAIVAGCESGPAPVAVDAPATSVSAPLDLARMRRGVERAFRPEGGAFVGGDRATYAARVEATGAFTVRPENGSVVGAPCTFATIEIGRGGTIQAPGGGAEATADGRVGVARGAGVVEHLANNDEGIEQSWTFAARPDGDGDLTVRIAVSGMPFAGATPSGLHFRDPTSGLGVRYGVATWVDARGARAEIPARFTGDAILLTAPRALVEASAYPATLDPTISAEIALDTPVSSTWVGGLQYPAIAYDGTNHLVVWTWGNELVGARVASDGRVLDPFGIVIAQSTSAFDGAPSIDFDGTNYMVVWSSGGGRAAWVSTAGVVLGTSTFDNGITLAGVAIAWSGSSHLVIYSYSNVRGQLLSSTGTPIGAPFSITTDYYYSPSVAFDGTRYLVVWGSVSGVRGARVSSTGTVLDATPIAVMPDTAAPAVAASSAGFFVVSRSWNVTTSTYWVHGARVGGDGTVLDPTAITITSAPTPLLGNPRTAYDGSNFVVTWPIRTYGGAGDIYAARINASGALLDTAPTHLGGSTNGADTPAIATDASGTLLAWLDGRFLSGPGGWGSILGARLSQAGAVLDPTGIVISRTGNNELAPAVAFDGTNYLVAWQDQRNLPNDDIYAIRVSGSGAILDTAAILVSGAAGAQRLPAAAYDGQNFWVVWQDARSGDNDIYGARVSSAGALLDTAGIPIAQVATTNQLAPAIACSSTSGCLVAWDDERNVAATNDNYSIYGAIVSRPGTVLPAGGAQFTNAAASAQYPTTLQGPAVASNGTGYLVAWTHRQPGASIFNIVGSRADSAGAVLDASGINIAVTGTPSTFPAVAFDGSNYVAVWQDTRNAASDIYGARIAATGTVLDPTGISITKGASALKPKIAPSAGSGSLAVWATWSGDVYGAWISLGGQLFDTASVPISADPKVTEGTPGLAAGANAGLLVAYERTGSTPATRVDARTIFGGLPIGGSCLVKDQCAARICADLKCCTTACDAPCQTCADPGSPGSCVSVKNADDLDTCTGNSTCDASGVCKSKSGQPCAGTADCASGFCVTATCCSTACGACGACDVTKGTCTPLATASASANDACAPYLCDGSSPLCPKSCSSDATCATGFYCAVGGTCVTTKVARAACNPRTDCASPPCNPCQSGFCVDGYCCNTACDGPCDECASIPGRCLLTDKGSAGSPSCAPFVCTGTGATCGSTCATDGDCATSGWCDGSRCQTKGDLGGTCSSDHECSSGHCVDKVCCDSACANQCEACDIAGSVGKCTPVAHDQPHPPRAACLGAQPGAPCSAPSCDGVDRTRCAGVASDKTVCAPGTCNSNTSNAGLCDGKGTCVVANRRCDPYACADGLCKSACSANSDCAPGNRCTDGKCVPGNTCDGDHTVTDTTGAQRDCSPYLCTPDGLCAETCRTTADCLTGFQCDESAKCSPVAAASAPSSGCSCRLGAAGPSGSAGALAAIAIATLARRRRRARSDRRAMLLQNV